MRRQNQMALRFLIVAVCYICSAFIGRTFAHPETGVVMISMATGVSLALLIKWGWKYAAGVFVAILFIATTAGLSNPVLAVCLALGNSLGVGISAYILSSFAPDLRLTKPPHILLFLIFGAVLGPAIASMVGGLSISYANTQNFANWPDIWREWFFGQLTGVLVFSPPVLKLFRTTLPPNKLSYYGELAFLAFSTIVVSTAIQTTNLLSRPEYLFIFAALPFVIWGAIRFSVLGATLVNALIVIDIISFAAADSGTFSAAVHSSTLSEMYIYIIASSVLTLIFSAGMERINSISAWKEGRIPTEIHRLRRNLAITVGVLGFIFSAAAALYTYGKIRDAEEELVSQYRIAFEASLRDEFDRATDTLVAMQTLFEVHGNVSFNTFEAMVRPWINRRTSVQSVQWAPYVTLRARQLIEENAIFNEVDNFEVRVKRGKEIVPAPPKPTYFPIYYVFPRSGNSDLIGLDINEIPETFSAANSALKTNQITLSEPLEDTDYDHHGIVAYAMLAVHKSPQAQNDPMGIAIAKIRLKNMISRAANVAQLPVDYELFIADLKAPKNHQLIYANQHEEEALSHIAEESSKTFNRNISTISFGHRDWSLIVHRHQSILVGLLYWQPWAIFIFGSAVSILLVIYLRSLTRTEKQIVDLVDVRTTELQKARKEAEASMKKAQEADRAKSEFIAHMSHEFRSPMTSIMGYSQLARDGLETKTPVETLQTYLTTIHSAGRHVLTLIGDVLDLSKIEAGRLQLEEIPTDIHRICEEVVSMMLVPARIRNNRLHIDISPDMTRWVIGDPVRIKQVLTNFVSNAIKFTQNGNIYVIASQDGEAGKKVTVKVSVKDEGIGIPAEKLSSIFGAFTQVDTSTTRRFGGTGLGLAICQKLVVAMGGKIDVASIEGEGSTFSFTLELPRCTPDQIKEAQQDLEDDAEGKMSEPIKSRQILLVEDIQVNRILATKLLEKQGHRITQAADGQQALEILETEDFDAILMDVHMPVMDGIEATRRIRNMLNPVKATIPILALTADNSNDNINEFRAAGMDAYCTKPLDIDAINRELNRHSHRMLTARKEQLIRIEQGSEEFDGYHI